MCPYSGHCYYHRTPIISELKKLNYILKYLLYVYTYLIYI